MFFTCSRNYLSLISKYQTLAAKISYCKSHRLLVKKFIRCSLNTELFVRYICNLILLHHLPWCSNSTIWNERQNNTKCDHSVSLVSVLSHIKRTPQSYLFYTSTVVWKYFTCGCNQFEGKIFLDAWESACNVIFTKMLFLHLCGTQKPLLYPIETFLRLCITLKALHLSF